jgi:glycosyltransferase involved in cell wall biosynthesis
MCTYNGERFIDAQVRSILGQTRPVDELIVVDDRSTDGTVDRVRRSIDQHRAAWTLPSPRVVVTVNETQLGTTRNFQRAIELTTGSVVVLSDQDDVWLPDRISTALARLDSNSALLAVASDAWLIDGDGARTGRTLLGDLEVSQVERRRIRGDDAFAQLLRRNLSTGATMTFRRELLDSALPFPEAWVHDEWLAILAAAVGSFGLIEEPLIEYRQHESNQIGVVTPTLSTKVGRVVSARNDRNRTLAQRGRVLVDRLETLGHRVPPRRVALARRKSDFEERRAALPDSRPLRIPGILREFVRGSYGAFASRGVLDVLRDLIQPA